MVVKYIPEMQPYQKLQKVVRRGKIFDKDIKVFRESATELLKGQKVKLLRGKYKGRIGEIQGVNYWTGLSFNIYIFRLDGREGFKGKEQFIDDHHNEYYEPEDFELYQGEL